MPRRTAQALTAIGSLLTATLVALSSTPAHAATATPPKVGECRAMTITAAAAYADTTKPVSCAKRHTAVTYAVPRVSTPLIGQTQDQLTALGEQACIPPLLRKLGRDSIERATSAYDFVFFQPTAAQIQAGADWFRCDLILPAGPQILPLPRHLSRPILPRRLDDGITKCLTSTHLSTPCSTRHQYRPIDSIRFKPVAYPTTDDGVQAGSELCPTRARYYTWGTPGRWDAGDRVLICYAKTRR